VEKLKKIYFVYIYKTMSNIINQMENENINININMNENENAEIKKGRGRKPKTEEEKQQRKELLIKLNTIDKEKILLTDELKKEIEERRQKHNERNMKSYKRNREERLEKARARYQEKRKNMETSSDTSGENNAVKKRGRPKKEYTKKDINKMQKAIKLLDNLKQDITGYKNILDNVINKENEKKEQPQKINKKNKSVEELNFVNLLKRNVKKQFV
jgi:hypothetical protein